MSVPEFRAIFEHEIHQHILRLARRKPGGGDGRELGAPEQGHGLEQLQLDSLRRAATEMMDAILQRLVDNADLWSLGPSHDAKENPQKAAVRKAAEVEQQQAQEECEARCQELEETLRQKRAEEGKLREEIVARFKNEYSAALQTCQQQLDSARVKAERGEAPCTASKDDAEGIRRTFVDAVTRIQDNLHATRGKIANIDRQRRELSQIQAQQRRPLLGAEAVLARLGEDAAVDADESELLDRIRHGERLVKRLRQFADEPL